MSEIEIPAEVCAAFGLSAAGPERVPSLINRTFRVQQRDGRPLIVQRLHSTFRAEVNLDLEAVTRHLLRNGFETPCLVRTLQGEPWVSDGGERVWRALSFIEGQVVHAVQHPDQAHSAAELLGRFHQALSTFDYTFRHVRAGAHDTAQHLNRLKAVQQQAASNGDVEVSDLGAAILEISEPVRLEYSSLPRRVAHGDLKISNILFWPDRPHEARCLIDLDTLGLLHIAYELGDALRSWCNPGGESQSAPTLSLDIFHAALRGYATSARGFLQPPEVTSIVEGLETICIELSARFAVDAWEDCYFGWDEQRYSSRREHNLVRARGQLALCGEVQRQRGELLHIAHDYLG